MKNQGCLLMRGGRGLDINRQSLLRNSKVFCRRSLNTISMAKVSISYLLSSSRYQTKCVIKILFKQLTTHKALLYDKE